MIYVRLTGGLGNQLFQFSAAWFLAKKHDTKVGLDLSMLNEQHPDITNRSFELHKVLSPSSYEIISSRHYNYIITTHPTWLERINRKLKRSSYYFEKNLTYRSEFNNLSEECYIEGFFQSLKYLRIDDPEFRSLFTFPAKISEKNQTFIREKSQKRLTAIHIRRGDYVTSSKINQIHGICSVEYYKSAVKLLANRDLSEFVIFSDDPKWVKENLKFDQPVHYVDWNQGVDAYQDLYLMLHCSDFIIANSSFSWWGAFMGEKAGSSVIYPIQWFKASTKPQPDIFRPQWMAL